MAHMEARTGRYRYVNTTAVSRMPFQVDMTGVDKCAADYYLRRAASPISVVGYTLRGSGVVIQNGLEKKVTEGTLFMVNVSDTHEYYPVKDWEFCWVNISGMFWRELLVQYGLEQDVAFSDFALGSEFQNLIHLATHDSVDINSWQIRMQGFLMNMILQLYRDKCISEEQTLAFRLQTEFEKYINTGQTQEEICRKIGITVRHAQRVFKEEYGISIHQFLTERRMQQARALLLGTNGSIRQIAESVGFENEKYFSAFFHKKEGVPPAVYRKQMRQTR